MSAVFPPEGGGSQAPSSRDPLWDPGNLILQRTLIGVQTLPPPRVATLHFVSFLSCGSCQSRGRCPLSASGGWPSFTWTSNPETTAFSIYISFRPGFENLHVSNRAGGLLSREGEKAQSVLSSQRMSPSINCHTGTEHLPHPSNRRVTSECKLVVDIVGDPLHFFPLIFTLTL